MQGSTIGLLIIVGTITILAVFFAALSLYQDWHESKLKARHSH